MSKKYTCAGKNSGGRVKGYASGGAVDAIELTKPLRGVGELRRGGEMLPYMKTPSQEVDEALARQKASDDKSRRGGKD